MRWLAILRGTLRSLLQRRQAEAELETEFAYSPEEARLAALRLIGPIALHQDACRDWRGTTFLEICARDVRYAIHLLSRTSPMRRPFRL